MSLPKPYYQDDAVTLYCAPCEQILPFLPKHDLLLTDPPYGLGDRWTGGTWGSNPMYADAKRWDRPLDPRTLNAAIDKSRGAIVWGGNYFTLPPSRGFLLWVKNPSMDTMADAEFAWTTFDHVSKAFTSHRNPDGKREHPTQKPLALMSWCVGYADSRGMVETILDPFAGSGTTGRAAKDLGRKDTLIECEEAYCEIAAKRMAQEVLAL